YPDGTAASKMLGAYAARLSTVEAHNTFRRRPRASALEGWAAAVPPAFTFALKAHVAITHQRDLGGVEDRVSSFFESLAPLGGPSASGRRWRAPGVRLSAPRRRPARGGAPQ